MIPSRLLVVIAIIATFVIGVIVAPDIRAFAVATITGADIVDKSVTGADLATDSVDGAKIKNLSIKTGDLGDGIVTSGKIKDGTIQRQDIATGILPDGATKVLYGSCTIFISTPQFGNVVSDFCEDSRVVADDHVVGSINLFRGFQDITLMHITTQAPDDQQDGFVRYSYSLNSNPNFPIVDEPATLSYIIFR